MKINRKSYHGISLLEARPELQKYYDPDINGGILLNDISKGSRTKITLRCDICFTLQKPKMALRYSHMRPDGKTFNTLFKCIRCNSVGAHSSQLAKEWHPKNKLSAFQVSRFNTKKAWWICDCGHEWLAIVQSRSHGCGCPSCGTQSRGEKIIEYWLIENEIEYITQYAAKIQENSWPRLFDFYLPELKLFVEVHGLQHFQEYTFRLSLEEQKKVDKLKQTYAEANGQYIMVDYREHDPALALERFVRQYQKIK